MSAVKKASPVRRQSCRETPKLSAMKKLRHSASVTPCAVAQKEAHLGDVATPQKDVTRPRASNEAIGSRLSDDACLAVIRLQAAWRPCRNAMTLHTRGVNQGKAMARFFVQNQDKEEGAKLWDFYYKEAKPVLSIRDPFEREIAIAVLKDKHGDKFRACFTLIPAVYVLDVAINSARKEMEQLALQLPAPVVVWATSTLRGFGMFSLAKLIAETGDLSKYSSPAKVWKRLGLGLVEDAEPGKEVMNMRQRRIACRCKSPKQMVRNAHGEVVACECGGVQRGILHGYSPRRRSLSWQIFETFFKQQGMEDDRSAAELYEEALARKLKLGKPKEVAEKLARSDVEKRLNREPPTEWRLLYDREKARQIELGQPKWLAHKRACRYVEKRLIRELWCVWNPKLVRDRTSHETQRAFVAHPV